MCGIAGIIGESFKKTFHLGTLRHRGPDDEGEWADPENRVWLGHTRLSILDLSETGAQPMSYLKGRYQIILNGEIYNFLELREELRAKGYEFRSNTDTEVIPAAFDLWGVECLNRFNGMFAFSLWDSVKKVLWLARDRFGEKPLYYHIGGKDFVFASEVKALHSWVGLDARLDTQTVQSICNGEFSWHGTERTYLADVRSVPAGHYLRKTRDDLTVKRWYQLRPNCISVPYSLEDQAILLRDLLADATRLRLRSDVPIATCLSGGIDSSSVAAAIHRGLMSHEDRMAKEFHRVFFAAFPGTILDETNAAKAIASALGVKLEILEIKPPTAERLLKAIGACDGPQHALAFYPIWELYGMISKNGIKVTLDGQGPDEMMGGYYESIQAALRSALSRGDLQRFWDIYRTYRDQGENRFRSSRAYARSELIQLGKKPLSHMKRLILAALNGGHDHPRHHPEYVHPIPANLSPLCAELYAQFCQKQLPTILQQYDRCSMAHGVECRMPFLDYRIVEYVFSLPESSLVSNGFTKRVLREAIRGIVPESTRLNKIKTGFNAPIVEWFMGPLRELILETMMSTHFRQCDYFDGPKLSELFETWLKGPNWVDAWAFWPPVHFALWKSQINTALSSLRKNNVRSHL